MESAAATGSDASNTKKNGSTAKNRTNSKTTQSSTPQSVHDIADNTVKDAGNKPSDHYRHRLSPLRYRLREWCLPLVRKETDVLARWQAHVRHPLLDLYFAWTANLASHTFYVLMLPLPIWFGASVLARDLVFVLGMGIYVTGFCKDFLCLPRPRSPPLHRITMLSYTTQEYGWPSSHAANATAVTLIIAARLANTRDQYPIVQYYGLMALLTVYYVSLVIGRVYCGMHGIFDIVTGSFIGLCMFLFRHYAGDAFDSFLLYSSRNNSWMGVIFTTGLIIFGSLALIHVYPEPVDDCPCFDDSVAFVGVLIGLDLAHYLCVLTGRFANNVFGDPILVPNTQPGIIRGLVRVVVGVVLVVAWKTILKPFLFTVLPPIYKFIGVYLPRSNFDATAHSHSLTRQIRSQLLSNMKHEFDIHNMLPPDPNRGPVDGLGPSDDIDAYEILDYQLTHPKHSEVPVHISGVFRKRYDVEIIGRTIVYAGISVVSVWGFALATEALGLA